jgi:hypothetical protein
MKGTAPTLVRQATGRRRPLLALAALLLALLLPAAPPAAAQEPSLTVESARLHLSTDGEPGLKLDADFALTLPAVLEDAVNRGIALYFTVDLEVYRERWYWFDRRAVEASLTYRLTYSPLTRQYRLARGAFALPFDDLDEAIATMTRVRNWKVAEPGALAAGADYRARTRMRLDTSLLPKPFQIDALTNRDWTLAADWRAVPLPVER